MRLAETAYDNPIEEAAAYPNEPFWLSDERSPWRCDLLVTLDHYTTCPRCAKHFGVNRVVLFAQVD